jgi:hypothetical protein
MRRTASGPSSGALVRFTDIAGAFERASGAIARIDALLTGHPLEPAWLWRTRLEAVRRQAAIDGRVIDLWHLAAVECVWFRMDRAAAIIDRGAIFEAARHARGLWRWFAGPVRPKRRRSGAPPLRCRRPGWARPCSAPRSASVPGLTMMANARRCGRRLRSIRSDAGCCTSLAHCSPVQKR